MAANPTDKQIKVMFTPRENRCDDANRKKLRATEVNLVNFAKNMRELLPDDMGSLAPILDSAQRTLVVATDVFEKRSGGGPVVPKAKPGPKPVKPAVPPQTPAAPPPVVPPVVPVTAPEVVVPVDPKPPVM